MARYGKQQVISKMGEFPIVPVFYDSNVEKTINVVKACYNGGIRVFEFTNRGDFAHDTFAVLMHAVEKDCPELSLGVGSVVEPATAALYIQMGADFIVGPLFNPEVAKICNRRGIPYIPGCGTVSEIGNAQEAGCDICKLFPGDVLGPAMVKGLMAPMPWSRIMVTGGVEPTEENLSGWFKAGTFAVGMGSKLFPKTTVMSQDWDAVSDKCRKALEVARKFR